MLVCEQSDPQGARSRVQEAQKRLLVCMSMLWCLLLCLFL
jgi:hypothetical protein